MQSSMSVVSLARASLLAVFLLAACGGSTPECCDSAGTYAEPALSHELAGTWVGDLTIRSSGAWSWRAITTTMTVHVIGDAITVTGVCPDGTGTITTRGEDESAVWTGVLECTSLGAICASEVLRLTNGVVRLGASGTLDVSIDGTVSGCGPDAASGLTFVGYRE